MKIFTQKDVEEFVAIWKDEFGEDISLDRAQAEAENLLQVVYDLRSISERRRRSSNEKQQGTSGG